MTEEGRRLMADLKRELRVGEPGNHRAADAFLAALESGALFSDRPSTRYRELVAELNCIRDESSEEEGFIFVCGRIDKKLLGVE